MRQSKEEKCTLCPLSHGAKRTCWSETLTLNGEVEGMAIAEAPGVEEDRVGRPLIGASGEEARHHLTINGIVGRGVVLDNICKCHPPDNRDPHADEVRVCTETHLVPAILRLKPKWIITMGRISTRFFLGDVDMEMSHGIPQTIDFHGHPLIIIPTYHPALGLHSPEKMILYHVDMRVAGDVIKGKLPPHPPVDEYPNPRYRVASMADIIECMQAAMGGGVRSE